MGSSRVLPELHFIPLSPGPEICSDRSLSEPLIPARSHSGWVLGKDCSHLTSLKRYKRAI